MRRHGARQGTAAFVALGVMVLVVAGVLGYRLSRQGSVALDAETTSLTRSGTAVDEALAAFVADEDSLPTLVTLRGQQIRMTLGSTVASHDPGVDRDVVLDWYRTDGTRYAYCLHSGPRHLTGARDGTAEPRMIEGAGGCPLPSLTPLEDEDAG